MRTKMKKRSRRYEKTDMDTNVVNIKSDPV